MDKRRRHIDTYLQFLSSHPELSHNEPGGLRILLDRREIEIHMESTGEQIGIIYSDEYVLVLRDLVENPSGRRFGYLRIQSPRTLEGLTGVVVVPVVMSEGAGGQVIFIRTFRHALRGWALELPRGFGEPGLDGPGNVRRELFEETGLEASSIVRIGTIQPDSGLMCNLAEVYHATISEAAKAPACPEDKEVIDGVVLLPLGALEDEVASGRITDGYSLAALALARSKGFLKNSQLAK